MKERRKRQGIRYLSSSSTARSAFLPLFSFTFTAYDNDLQASRANTLVHESVNARRQIFFISEHLISMMIINKKKNHIFSLNRISQHLFCARQGCSLSLSRARGNQTKRRLPVRDLLR